MKKIAILGSSGYQVNQHSRDLAASLEIAGANTGNMVFQYAARKMIGDTAEVYNLAIGEDSVWRRTGALLDSVDFVVMPAANNLRRDADWELANRWIETIHKPFVVLGLGAQADSTDDPHHTTEALRQNASVVRMCELLAQKAVFVGVRGEFSRQVAAGLGIHQAEITGCPSLMLSERADLGQRLQYRLDRIRAEPHLARFCMVAEAPYNLYKNPGKLSTEQALFRFIREHRGTYIQQSGGEAAILAATGQLPESLKDQVLWQLEKMAPELSPADTINYLRSYGRVFFSAPDWIEYLRKFDLCIGHRFHGNMAAMGADRLGIVVCHDSRTSELVDHMQIPRVSSTLFGADSPSAEKVLARIEFDPVLFDQQRAGIAARWTQIFGAMGVPLEDYVHAIATSAHETGATYAPRQARPVCGL